MLSERHLVAGYAGYPPFLRRDPNTGAISGYSVDLIKGITDPLGVTLEWRETTWDNMKQDLLLGKFDLMVEPIFYTIPRAAQVAYTRPYAYFGYGVPVVRKGERRFKRLEDLNNPDVTIAVTQGVTDQEFAARRLPRARLKLVPGNDISITLTEVLAGKVDAALADVPTVLQFLKAHPNEVEALFLDSPPAITPAGFMVRQADLEFLHFLDTAL
jgi:ABC-type amino acid transport substrate-binding protein